MTDYPKISIITPSFNQGAFLEEAIDSILSQNYPNLEYIIIDGGSTDHSIEIIKKYEKNISFWISEKDQGLYHALQKGLAKSTGEIMGWLNSDDLLHRKSLFILANIFEHNQHINWIQGRPSMYDESGMTVDTLEPVYSKFHFYLKAYTQGHFIQQESTYWRRSLWQKAGGAISTKYKYAGDFDLWMKFFRHDLLHYTRALLGGYRVRAVQISRSYFDEYLEECNRIIDEIDISTEEAMIIKKLKFQQSRVMKSPLTGPLLRRIVKGVSLEQDPVSFDYNSGTFWQERQV